MRKGFLRVPRQRMLARAARPELKQLLGGLSSTSNYSGIPTCVPLLNGATNPPQGTGGQQRVGDTICVWRIDFFVDALHPNETGIGHLDYDPCLIGVYVDRNYSGAIGGTEQLYDRFLADGYTVPGSDFNGAVINQRFRITGNPNRWIAWDHAIQLCHQDINTLPFGARPRKTVRKSLVFRKGLRVNFADPYVATSDKRLHANHIYLYYIGSNPNGAAFSSRIITNWRIWYTDV